jgi:hypothetical protein
LIAQTDYNKVERGKKMGFERVLSRVQRLRYEGTFEHGKEIGVLFYD